MDMLRRMDHEPAAVVAKQELPDPVGSEEVAKLGERLDIFSDDPEQRHGRQPTAR